MRSKFRVRMLEETTSTNDEVKRALKAGEAEGLVICARRQVSGYGRQGRTWISPEGGLYCSLLLRPSVELAALPTLSLVVGIAVRRAVVALVGEAAAETVRIKWPNDVVVFPHAARESSACASDSAAGGSHGARLSAPAKLCGISCEACAGGVCVGAGINVVPPGERPDVGGKNEPAYVADLASAPVTVERMLEAFLESFDPLYETWLREGFAAVLDEYNAYASLTGRNVSIADRSGSPLASGTVSCVDAQGRLVLRDDSGAEHAVSSGEAHLV